MKGEKKGDLEGRGKRRGEGCLKRKRGTSEEGYGSREIKGICRGKGMGKGKERGS